MDKSLKGTKTEANLWAAFAGESQARNKYTFYASSLLIMYQNEDIIITRVCKCAKCTNLIKI